MDVVSREEKSKLFSLFKNLKTDDPTDLGRTHNSHVLIIDGLNTYMRCFMVNPSMNADGIHTGGVAGFLKSIGYAIKTLHPTRVVIVFDGQNGSVRRRKIFPQYKDGRKTKVRLNRIYFDDDSLNEEEKNLKQQLLRTINYLDILPVSTLSIDNVEADDVIAYLGIQTFKEKVYIMSSDKDFLQLTSDRIKVWSPTKQKLYNVPNVIEEYGIHPNNFVIYRALDGDKSDNIEGLKGFGEKTIQKAFPFLREEKKVNVEDLVLYSQQHQNDLKVFSTLLENQDRLKLNVELMQLSDTYIPIQHQLSINKMMDESKKEKNLGAFLKLIKEDKMYNNIPNHPVWYRETFGTLIG